MIIATACTMNELLEPTYPSGSGDNVVTISPRIAHYTDYNVTTRSAKEGDEAKVTSMAMALFPIENGEIKPSVYYQYNGDGNMLFVLDRNRPPFTDANGNEPYKDKQFVMYIIANMQGSGIPETSGNGEGVGWTPKQFVEKYHSITNGDCFEKIHDNGLPMIGMLGDAFSTYGDGSTFIFHPTKDDANKNGLPTVNGIPTDNLEIPMRSLYAKFSFTINVDSEQEIVGNPTPRFDLEGYQVVNASNKVYLNRQLNEDNDQTGYGDVVTSEFHNVLSEGLYAQGATKATFFFYVPERYLTPNIPASSYQYDLGVNGGVCDGYENIPGNLKNYAQRFKPELVKEQNATYVAIKGKFTDHQKHVYDVTYRIYLGKDNYGDFNIVRNTHYNNFITIKGIDNSDDQSANYDPDNLPDDAIAPISIDHRVSIERTTPLVVGLRRETLLDAHIEVRPLRLHLSGGDQATNPTRATVTLKKVKDSDPDLSDWIAMEKSGNTSDHITETNTPSDGKRKYFTTNLISSIYSKAETNDDGNIVITVDGLGYNANQTVWLYVDENISTTARSAVLQIEYNYKDPDTQMTAAPENYIITQYGLHKITSESGRTYYIEEFEEYLYNYDVEDLYGQTKQEGMPWGLDGVQLSHIHDSFICEETNSDWTSYIQQNPLKYDFYIGKHDDDNENSDVYTKDGGTLHNFAGQEFTQEIAGNSGVKYLTLAESASGAVEYCYSRNKRNADGSVDLKWYLPSADELEDFIVAGYSDFKEFQDNYYWTSQPAYIRNAFYYEYHNGSSGSNAEDTYVFVAYEDNTEYARATKVIYANGGYDYAESGLPKTSEKTHAMDQDCIDNNANDLGYYFNVMKAWYRYTELSWSSFKNVVVTREDTFTTEDKTHFWERKDGKATNVRYHIHVGHLSDMIKEMEDAEYGYHRRTKNNRVRCVRVAPTP